MKTIKLKKSDFIGLGPNGRTLFFDDIKNMNVGDEYSNVTTYGELTLRATRCSATKLFLQLEERYYNRGVLYKTAVVERYEVERG